MILLAIWSTVEFLTQAKLVPFRNLYTTDILGHSFSGSMARGVDGRFFPFMSLGPYYIHHTLAATLCVLVDS